MLSTRQGHAYLRALLLCDSALWLSSFYSTESASPTVLRPTSSLYGVDQYNCLFHGGSSNRNGIVHFAYGNSASVMIMDRYQLVVSCTNTTSKSKHVNKKQTLTKDSRIISIVLWNTSDECGCHVNISLVFFTFQHPLPLWALLCW